MGNPITFRAEFIPVPCDSNVQFFNVQVTNLENIDFKIAFHEYEIRDFGAFLISSFAGTTLELLTHACTVEKKLFHQTSSALR